MPRKQLTAYAFDAPEEALLLELAEQANMTPLELLRLALYTYDTLQPYRESGVYVQYRNAQHKLIVKKLELP